MPKNWDLGPIREECTNAEGEYIRALRALAQVAAKSLNTAAGLVPASSSFMSRVLHGDRMPKWDSFTHLLYVAALGRADLDCVMPLSELRRRHDAAERSRKHQKLVQELRELQRAQTPEHESQEIATDGAALPVPRPPGDRQAHAPLTAPTRHFAKTAAELAARPEALLSVLRGSADVLTPLESAAGLYALRQEGHDGVVDAYIDIYARDQHCSRVLLATLTLLENYRMEREASAMLRAALKSHAGSA